MSNGIVWDEKDKASGTNTAIVAGDQEQLIDNPKFAANWNKLLVQNFDVVDVAIYLDGQFLAKAGKNQGAVVVDPSEGINFYKVVILNLDGVTAETAGKITVRASYAVPKTVQ
jgi:hypothetical protein